MKKRKEPKSNKPRHNQKQEGERVAGKAEEDRDGHAAITAKNSNSSA